MEDQNCLGGQNFEAFKLFGGQNLVGQILEGVKILDGSKLWRGQHFEDVKNFGDTIFGGAEIWGIKSFLGSKFLDGKVNIFERSTFWRVQSKV